MLQFMPRFVIFAFLLVLLLLPNRIAEEIDLSTELKEYSIIGEHLLTITPTRRDSSGNRLKRRDSANPEGTFVLIINAENRTFLLDLEINMDIFSAGVPAGVDIRRFLKGSVRGFPGSTAWVTIWSDHFEGSFDITEWDAFYEQQITRTYWAQKIDNIEVVKHLRRKRKRDLGASTEAPLTTSNGTEKPVMVLYRNEDMTNYKNRFSCAYDNDPVDPNVKEAGPPPSLAKRSTPVLEGTSNSIWSGKVCTVAVVLDHLFVQQHGVSAREKAITRIMVSSQIFKATYNITLAIVDLVLLNATGDLGWTTSTTNSIESMLSDFATAGAANQFKFTNQSFCVAHMFTYQEFVKPGGITTLGLARAYTVCDKNNGYAVTTGLSYLIDPLGAMAHTITHEIGHNFGSRHDGDPTDPELKSSASSLRNSSAAGWFGYCALDDNPFIMSVYSAPFSNNNKKFSLCSQYEHETVMRSRENVTNCFLKNDDALKAKLLTALTNYTAPFVPWEDQCANLNNNPLFKSPGVSYQECNPRPTSWYNASNFCNLQCQQVQNSVPGKCLSAITIPGKGALKRSDGTVCGWTGDTLKVCVDGACVVDTTSVCDRQNACCDSYGKFRSSSSICRSTKDIANACKSDDYCDPLNPIEKDRQLCPVGAQPPKYGCNCPTAWKQEGCTGVCGRNEMWGLCLIDPAKYSTVNEANKGICDGNTCNSTLTCIPIAGKPYCGFLAKDSCQFLCDNTVIQYKTTLGWGCSCDLNCKATSNCCSDFEFYCQLTPRKTARSLINTAVASTFGAVFLFSLIPGIFFMIKDKKASLKKAENKKKAVHDMAKEKAEKSGRVKTLERTKKSARAEDLDDLKETGQKIAQSAARMFAKKEPWDAVKKGPKSDAKKSEKL